METAFIPVFLRWILVGLLLAGYGFILWKLVGHASLSRRQKGVKLLLNTVLLVLLVLFLFPPEQRAENGESVLIWNEATDKTERDSVRLHYKITREITEREFRNRWDEYRHHRLFFFGPSADPSLLSRLAGYDVRWIPYVAPSVPHALSWEGVLRRGDLQTVTGKIRLPLPGTLRLTSGEKTLDSLVLPAGFTPFELSFPVQAIGRNSVSLSLDHRPLYEVNFYARERRHLSVLLLLDYPDLESRMLTEWLGRQGHRVHISTPVARSAVQEARVNAPPVQGSPDLVIATPGRADDPGVKKAVVNRKSVLFFGLGEVNDDLARINRSAGTRFSARRTSAAESRVPDNEVNSLPYTFNELPRQRSIGAWPAAYQQAGARVAVSLLNETFPLRLRGDSLVYEEIWGSMISALDRSDSLMPEIQAPVFTDVPVRIALRTKVNQLYPAGDTLYVQPAFVQPEKKTGHYIFADTGWHALPPLGEVYVENGPQKMEAVVQNWFKSNAGLDKSEILPERGLFSSLQWFWLFFLCLAALWTESKFIY